MKTTYFISFFFYCFFISFLCIVTHRYRESRKRESSNVRKWEKLKLRMYMRNRGNFHSIISSKLRQVLS